MNEIFRMAWDDVRNAKVRSGLTMLGIVLGIFAVVALISINIGLGNAINEQLKSVGSNRLIITPGGGTYSSPVSSGLTSAKLYDHDVEVVKRVRGVEFAVGVLIKTTRIAYDSKTKYLFTFAHDTDEKTINFLKGIEYFEIENGRYLQSGDKYKTTVGPNVVKDVFGKEIKLRDKIKIEGQDFEIVGVYKKTGNPAHDNKIVIPLDLAREMFNSGEEVSTIFVTVKEGSEPSEIAEYVKRALRRDRDLKEGEEDFTVQTAEQLVQSFQSILGMVQILLLGIASISLLVGGVGIMSTMYTSVLERTKDIGIMKAVGARNWDIMYMFLMESGIIGIGGGVIGVLLGLGVSKIVEIFAAQAGFEMLKAYFGLDLILGAIAFSFFIGCLSGLLPSRRAAKMNPVEALRYG